MSSEMREIKAMADAVEYGIALGKLDAPAVFTKMRDLLNLALLARTEAGADGVGQSGAFKMTMRMAEMHAAAILLLRKLDEVHKDPKYMAVWEIAQNHIGPYKGPQYTAELARLRAATVPFEEYTHPQDASGDAVMREALERIRDYEGDPRTPVRNSAKKSGIARAALNAMQAKEAK